MSTKDFHSHLAMPLSIDRALDDAIRRIELLDPARFETKYGFGLGSLMRRVADEFGNACGLRFEAPREFLVSLAEEAARSEIGRFLLCSRGLNWRTTDLLFDPVYHEALRAQERDRVLPLFDKLAFFIFPLFLATQERAGIHRKQTQAHLRNGAVLASLPCGRMRDLLTLDFTSFAGVRLVGIDKDPEALQGARSFALETLAVTPLHGTVEYRLGDAMQAGMTTPPSRDEFDLVTSSGLNIYLTDEQCVFFYRHIYEAMKPGSRFITGHILPPAEYRWERINRGHWELQAVALTVLIGALWESLVKPKEAVQGQLEAAGFRDVEILPDTQRIFPTFVSRKPG